VEFDNYHILALEVARGGSLFDLLFRKRRDQELLSDLDCSKIIKSILEGVAYLHSKDILHRDLKPGNILFEEPDDLESVKIADFGLSIKLTMSNHSLHVDEKCGTLLY
jgi:serine/threonine protein kinase